MDLSNKIYIIFALFTFTLIINLPLGYARSKARKYSLRWFLFIHIPIPLIFIMRTFSNIEIKYIPFFALAAIIGQIAGGKLEY